MFQGERKGAHEATEAFRAQPRHHGDAQLRSCRSQMDGLARASRLVGEAMQDLVAGAVLGELMAMSLVDGAQDLPKTPALIVNVGAARRQEHEWRRIKRVWHGRCRRTSRHKEERQQEGRRDRPQPQPAEPRHRPGASFESARHLRVP